MIRVSVRGLAALARLLRPRRYPTVRLAELSDHMLADIGLRRDQIATFAWSGDPRILSPSRPPAEAGLMSAKGAAPHPSPSSNCAVPGENFIIQEPRRSTC